MPAPSYTYSDEKQDYFYDEDISVSSHSPPSIQIAPPRAALLVEPQSPGLGSPRSVNFGDGRATPTGNPAGSRLRPDSSINWSRFSMAARAKPVDGKAEKGWLEKKTSQSRRWITLGWMGALLVIALIAGLVAWHFVRPRTTTTPEVISLGGLDGKSTTTSVSSTTSSKLASVASATTASVAPVAVAVVQTSLSATSAAVAPTSTSSTSAVAPSTSASTRLHSSSKSTSASTSSSTTSTRVKRRVPFGIPNGGSHAHRAPARRL